MKKIIFASSLICLSFLGFTQSDTLFTRTQKIICKLVEINENEFKYRSANNPEGPVYFLNRATVLKYTLSNGISERVVKDELSLENEHAEILDNREVIKVHPFAFAFNHVSLSYEKVLKVGTNLDVEIGYINSSINSNPLNTVFGNPFHTGVYIKPGLKFFLGHDYSVKGLRYAHPLKGKYIKLDFAASFINYQGFKRTYYSTTQGSFGTSTSIATVTSNLNAVAYGGFVNFGQQHILGNILTLDYYVGIGFTAYNYQYTNINYTTLGNTSYYIRDLEANGIYNFYGFLRAPAGLSFTSGFRIGYIIPATTKKRKTT
ncbi:MAG: hypothetical protein HYX39_07390 [Bacteroidetes bacterium]|nr:hypothetical protein [Bacteroidota bacterium]